MPIVYDEMRRLAHNYMRGERAGHVLQASALVNEAYIRLVDHNNMNWQNRGHFFAVAAQAMRRVLIDYARRHLNQKGSGNYKRTDFEEGKLPADERQDERRAVRLIAVHEALFELEKIDELKCRIVELRFFLDLGIKETAEALGVSEVTIERKWSAAKAWLHHELTRKGEKEDALTLLEDDTDRLRFPPYNEGNQDDA